MMNQNVEAMSDCKACYGTGRFQGKFAGPEWPRCPECNGTGKENGPSEDTMLERYVLSAMAVDSLTRETERLRAALEWIDRRDEVGQYIRDKIHEALSPQWGKPI